MVVSVHVSSALAEKKFKVHHVPCNITFNGAAKISTYFEPNISRQEDGGVQSSLRGRPLFGKELKLSKNYIGIVLSETNRFGLNEDAHRNMYGRGTFEKFTYWNYDETPNPKDGIVSAMDWCEIACELHSPVD